MLDWLSAQVACDQIGWLDEAFKFELEEDPTRTRLYRVGGLLGLTGSRKLSDAQKMEMRKFGISPSDAWKEVAYAKANYIFCVVDNAAPQDGCKIAVETAQLGDALKCAIRDTMTRRSPKVELGDPTRNPYALRFTYNPAKNVPFNEKYHVIPMDGIPLTDQIDALISSEPPDTSSITREYDPSVVRASLEEAALIDMPWDEFFPGTAGEESASEEEDGDLVACDSCRKGMDPNATVCPHCGYRYGEPEPVKPPLPEPKKAMPIRSRTRRQAPQEESVFDLPSGDVSPDDIPF
jgi:hypothetical protein